jgi:hypothetical protein
LIEEIPYERFARQRGLIMIDPKAARFDHALRNGGTKLPAGNVICAVTCRQVGSGSDNGTQGLRFITEHAPT